MVQPGVIFRSTSRNWSQYRAFSGGFCGNTIAIHITHVRLEAKGSGSIGTVEYNASASSGMRMHCKTV